MQLGPQVHAARTRRGWTLAALAAASGLSKGFVSQVEHDKTSPSLDTLERLAGALDLTVLDLLRGAAEPPPPPHTVSGALNDAASTAGPRAPIRPAGRLLAEAPRPAVAPAVREISPPGSLLRSFVVAMPPGTTLGEPGHQHAGEESLVVVQGALVAEQAGARLSLAAGDALTWTPGQAHRLLNRSPDAARVLITLLAPATLGATGVLGSPAPRATGPPPAGRPLRLVQMRAARQASGP